MADADFPEVKQMVEAARKFLEGKITIQELHGDVAACAYAAKLFSAHPLITELAQRWLGMVSRYWDEWELEKEPLSEEQFRLWLEQEIECREPKRPAR